jgi:hypothetical protein
MRIPALMLLAGCVVQENVTITFGDNGEGLDGFLCKDASKAYVLDRLEPLAGVDGGMLGADGGVTAPGGMAQASLITDFLTLGGVPDCRISQLIEWCKTHDCHAIPNTQKCTTIELPTGVTGMDREVLRGLVLTQIKALKGHEITNLAPDGFTMLRVVATAQTCDQAMAYLDPQKLVGGAYTCPVDFDHVEGEVFVGFDTLTGICEQGLRTMSSQMLTWQP